MGTINTWVVRCDVAKTVENGLYAQVYFNQNYTVWGLTPGDQDPQGDVFLVDLLDLGGGQVAFQCHGDSNGCPNAFASARVGDYNGQVQFQAPNGVWITQVQGDEEFRIFPTGDGFFAIYSATYNLYVTINPVPDGDAQNCYPLNATTADINQAARFYAYGKRRPFVLDFLDVGQDASGLSFANADIAGRNLTGFTLLRCDLTQVAGIENCILDNANMQHANLSGVNLATVSISGTDFTNATLVRTNFSAVKSWSQPPILTGTNMTGAVLPASLAGAHMEGVQLNGVALNGVDLSNANLTDSDLRGAIVAGGVLTGAKLIGAKMNGLNLQGVKMTGADLTGAQLAGCNLAGVDLTGTILAGTDFTGVDLTTTTMPQPLTRSTDENARTIFANCRLPYSVIGQDWSYLDLTGTDIVGVPSNLTGLNAAHANLPSRSFDGCILNGAQFSNAVLTNAVFSDANLHPIDAHHKPTFDGANMTRAVFTRAKLDDASFVGTVLGGVSLDAAAVFSFAYVNNCNFTSANMFGVSFAGATLMGDNKLSGSANLQETDFSNAYLLTANFTGASLQGAKFDGAFMVECVLTNAQLSPTREGSVRASLTAACLQAAKFQGTNLSAADLTNAVITDTAGSITMQYYDENGNLTKPYALGYPAGSFPAAASFDASTVCPNGTPYGTNVSQGLSIAQMMVAPNPPTSWSPGNKDK